MEKKRVVIGLSGGVDSSCSAIILKEAGYDVYGLTFKIGYENSDIKEAEIIAEKLGINHKIVDIKEEFRDKVISYFLDGYMTGKTPSPCLICNREIKFAVLNSYAKEIEAEYISTGHYASIEERDGIVYLKRGKSIKKDQSYMLYRLEDDMIKKLIFPLAHKEKSEVREMLEKNGVEFYEKGESQGICFAKSGYEEYIKENLGSRITEGEIRDRAGTVLGKHKGYQLYTIGQRRGLGMDCGRPYFIVDIDMADNLIIVGEYEELYRKRVELEKEVFHGVYREKIKDGFNCIARPRFSSSGFKAFVKQEESGVVVEYDKANPQNAPGQHLVIYDGEIVAGGGIIGSKGFYK